MDISLKSSAFDGALTLSGLISTSSWLISTISVASSGLVPFPVTAIYSLKVYSILILYQSCSLGLWNLCLNMKKILKCHYEFAHLIKYVKIDYVYCLPKVRGTGIMALSMAQTQIAFSSVIEPHSWRGD